MCSEEYGPKSLLFLPSQALYSGVTRHSGAIKVIVLVEVCLVGATRDERSHTNNTERGRAEKGGSASKINDPKVSRLGRIYR